MRKHHPLADRILFGAAFYDEYRTGGSLEHDLDLMADAGFSVIRVGESVWASWEPEPGVFSVDWLEPVLDGAAARGIDVILGTPTYAVPPWLRTLHPDIAAESATGVRVPWGYRQEINYASAVFREHAERVIRAVLSRYATHQAVIGFQVDNEPGLHLLHNEDVFAGFLDYLRGRYGTVEVLNHQWGLVFWSHRVREWNELWRPDGNHSPQYDIEWRRYQALVVNEFIGWQASIVREYARADQFVTTCISYERPAVDDVGLVRELDVTAGNPYYRMQDGLRAGVEVPRSEVWWSSGVWGLVQQGDRMYSSAQEPFLVTETNAQSIGQSHWENHPPYPGQIELAAFALISRGARMIEYWQWQTLPFGVETYWGGVLPHSGRPGRIYREISALGARIRTLEPMLEDYVPDADVAFLYSTDTKRTFEFYPPLADAQGGPDRHSYLRIFDAFYRGAFDAGAQVRIIHAPQIADVSPEDLVREHPVLVVPTLYAASDQVLDLLVAYARAGGHLVVGVRTGYGDELARARREVAPGRLAVAAGLTYEEFSTLDGPVAVASDELQLVQARATGWADLIVAGAARSLVEYAAGPYAGNPAVTTHEFGQGQVTYVGTVPDRELAAAIVSFAVGEPLAGNWVIDAGITVTSGRARSGRVWFVSNWSEHPAQVTTPFDLSDGTRFIEARTVLPLDPWELLVLHENV